MKEWREELDEWFGEGKYRVLHTWEDSMYDEVRAVCLCRGALYFMRLFLGAKWMISQDGKIRLEDLNV